MDVPGECPIRGTVRCRVEDLDGTKVEMYHQNPLMSTWEYKLEYGDGTNDRYFSKCYF